MHSLESLDLDKIPVKYKELTDEVHELNNRWVKFIFVIRTLYQLITLSVLVTLLSFMISFYVGISNLNSSNEILRNELDNIKVIITKYDSQYNIMNSIAMAQEKQYNDLNVIINTTVKNQNLLEEQIVENQNLMDTLNSSLSIVQNQLNMSILLNQIDEIMNNLNKSSIEYINHQTMNMNETMSSLYQSILGQFILLNDSIVHSTFNRWITNRIFNKTITTDNQLLFNLNHDDYMKSDEYGVVNLLLNVEVSTQTINLLECTSQNSTLQIIQKEEGIIQESFYLIQMTILTQIIIRKGDSYQLWCKMSQPIINTIIEGYYFMIY